MIGDLAIAATAAPFIGSFMGTLVLRLPANEPILIARSACPDCGATLRARELVPIASWIVQRARCANCQARISAFYPAIELGAVAIVAWAATQTAGVTLFLSCVLGWALLTLAVMDWRTLRLADALTLPLLAAGLCAAFLVDRDHWWDHVLGAALGLVLILALATAYRAVRGHEGIGLGDAKLLAAGGAWVGWQGIAAILIVASVTALLAILIARLFGRRTDLQERIPFGGFLALGIWLAWLYGPAVPNWP